MAPEPRFSDEELEVIVEARSAYLDLKQAMGPT